MKFPETPEECSQLFKTLLKNDTFMVNEYKTMDCPVFERFPHRGETCPYYHAGEVRRRHYSRHSPSLCPHIQPSRICPNGDACGFAHSMTELRLHPEVFAGTMKCPFGQDCNVLPTCFFSHDAAEEPTARAREIGGSSSSALQIGGSASRTRPAESSTSRTMPFGGSSAGTIPYGGASPTRNMPFGGSSAGTIPYGGASPTRNMPFGGSTSTAGLAGAAPRRGVTFSTDTPREMGGASGSATRKIGRFLVTTVETDDEVSGSRTVADDVESPSGDSASETNTENEPIITDPDESD